MCTAAEYKYTAFSFTHVRSENVLDHFVYLTSSRSMRSHPVQGFRDEDKAQAYAITIHGDEGSGKHGRSVLVLSWSPLGMTKDPMFCKFPFADSRMNFF